MEGVELVSAMRWHILSVQSLSPPCLGQTLITGCSALTVEPGMALHFLSIFFLSLHWGIFLRGRGY